MVIMLPFYSVELPVLPALISHQSIDTEKPPTPGDDRKFRESEAILRRHRIHIPQLVDIIVPGTARVGKTWT